MGNKKLTALAVEKAKPGKSRLEIPDGSSLYLIIQPSGSKSWAFRYRSPLSGKQCKLALGSAETVSLEAARAKARKARTEIDEGGDPAADKAAVRAAKRPTDRNEVEIAVSAFISTHAKAQTREATWRESERILRREIVERWRGKPLTIIRQADLRPVFREMLAKGHAASARRSMGAIRPFFGWAVDEGLITTNPCDGIKIPAPKQERDRALSDSELRAVWRAADEVGYPFGRIVQLLVLLGQRRDEVAGLLRSELDLAAKEWTLPSERAKNGRPHIVPLPSLAVSILEGLPRIDRTELLFTTTGKTPFSGFGKAKAALDKRIEATGFKMEPWTLHDLRRSMATGAQALGIAPQVVDAILNHKAGTIRGVGRIYMRHDYKKEKVAALNAWVNHLERFVLADPADNVVELRR